MIKRLELKPEEFECTLGEAPAGMFLHTASDGTKLLGTKTNMADRNDDQRKEVINDEGSMFWGGTTSHAERDALKVVPLLTKWYDVV